MNPSEFQRSTEPRLETPPPFPSAEVATTLVERAEDGNDETLEAKLQRVSNGYDEIQQLLDAMDCLVKRLFNSAGAVAKR